MQPVLRFNGGLFDQATALPLTDEQIGLEHGVRPHWPNIRRVPA